MAYAAVTAVVSLVTVFVIFESWRCCTLPRVIVGAITQRTIRLYTTETEFETTIKKAISKVFQGYSVLEYFRKRS
jgi:hypothetical protein